MALASSPLPVNFLDAAIGLIIITNLSLLAAEGRRISIRLIALQGIILGLLPIFAYPEIWDWHLGIVAFIIIGVKGIALPALLRRTCKALPPQGPGKPYLSNTACVLVGMAAFVFSLWFGSRLGATDNPLFSLVFPSAFSTIFTGLLLIVTRKKALTQMFGYLILENGIFLLGVPMAHLNSVWLELSILLDILVAAFVMGIAIHHINRAFDSTDVENFSSLRD